MVRPKVETKVGEVIEPMDRQDHVYCISFRGIYYAICMTGWEKM